MKLKSLALLLAITLLAACFPAASLAETLDMDYFRSRPNLFNIEVTSNSAQMYVAYVTSPLKKDELAFTHEYALTYPSSITYFDICAVSAFGGNLSGTLRLWIDYVGSEVLNIDSASFIFGGKEYTFLNLGRDDWRETNPAGAREQLLIRFGNADSRQFLADLVLNIDMSDSEFSFFDPVTLVLHGEEDISAELGHGFLVDFLNLMIGAMDANVSFEDDSTPIEIADFVR